MLDSKEAANAAALIAAENRFGPEADLADPAIAEWVESYATQWADGVRRTRDGLSEIMKEPNAWANRSFVYAAYLDAGVSASAVIATLRAMRGVPSEGSADAA